MNPLGEEEETEEDSVNSQLAKSEVAAAAAAAIEVVADSYSFTWLIQNGQMDKLSRQSQLYCIRSVLDLRIDDCIWYVGKSKLAS